MYITVYNTKPSCRRSPVSDEHLVSTGVFQADNTACRDLELALIQISCWWHHPSSMSANTISGPGIGKKAVHVKWAGKTIALGTFPSDEADEKCQKAKALTRAWRSTIRPKPSREWVMLELERLGVRVVSGRLGRKAGDEGDEQSAPQDHQNSLLQSTDSVPNGNMASVNPGINGLQQRSGSLGWGNEAGITSLMAQRNSSLGLSMINDTLGRRGSLGSLGQVIGLEGDSSVPPHRPFVGGGAAAAYEAARHDHFTQKSAEQQQRASSLGIGSLAGSGIGGMGMSVNPNQHYEMLKLHHMNLLNEIQETTLMMNLYQQQQLQQQQQQLQNQASVEMVGVNSDSHAASQISMLMQHGGAGNHSIDNLFGTTAHLQQRASLGLGANSGMGNLAGNAIVKSGGASETTPGNVQSAVSQKSTLHDKGFGNERLGSSREASIRNSGGEHNPESNNGRQIESSNKRGHDQEEGSSIVPKTKKFKSDASSSTDTSRSEKQH